MEKTHAHYTELCFLKELTPGFAFDESRESFGEWKQKSRRKLRLLLGLENYFCDDLAPEETSVCRRDGFTEIRFSFLSEKNARVPCVLLLPEQKAEEKPPLMICLQGHGTGMHISLGQAKYEPDEKKIQTGDRDFAVQCVRRGIAALAIEQRCFGERGGNPRPDCHGAALTALLTGRTLIGGRVWDIMRAIDVIEKLYSDRCDCDRIWCMGNSGGGTATIYAFALEDRIKAAIPSCAFCSFEASIGSLPHCECNYVPGIAKYFDMAELVGMAAPKPVVIVSGMTDGIFPIEGAESEFRRLERLYAASGAKGKAVHVKGSEGHRFYASQAWEAFDLLTGRNGA